MVKVAGIRFRKAGKIYYFDPGDIDISTGEHVIVETVRGVEYGTVVLAGKEVEEEEVVQPLKKVLRLATEEDKALEVKNKEKEREAFTVCKSKIIKHGLDMKLIDCEYTFDNNKLLFYFTADGRVDFRELVKDLASVFKTRIELRQIGVRDETKMIGSIGICGRTLCCHAHLSDFHPVSIKMAKDQNLSLNPTKISGVCGRLMCCLKYEEETYKELNKNLPRIGDRVKIIESGVIAEVIKTNIIRQQVKIIIRKEDGAPEILEMKLADLELKRQGKFQQRPVKKEDVAKTEDAKASESKVKKDGKEREQRNNRSRQNKPRNNNQKQQANKTQNKKQGNKQVSKPKATEGQKQQANKPKPQNSPNKNKAQKATTTEGGQQEKKTNSNNRNRNRRPRNRNNKPKTSNDGSASKE